MRSASKPTSQRHTSFSNSQDSPPPQRSVLNMRSVSSSFSENESIDSVLVISPKISKSTEIDMLDEKKGKRYPPADLQHMPEIYEKDEAMDGKQEAKEGKKAPLWSIVIIWYGASVLCTNSSKTLTINGWSSNGITFAQLLFSVICSSVVALFGGFHYVPLQSRDEIIQTATISFFFVLG